MHDEVWWPATRAYIVMLARRSVEDNPSKAVLQKNVHCNVLYVGAWDETCIIITYNIYIYLYMYTAMRQLPHAMDQQFFDQLPK